MDWHDVFITGDGAPVRAPPPEAPRSAAGFFRRLRDNMSKTRQALASEVQATLLAGELDTEAWERLEEALIYADVGARTTAEVVERLEREVEEGGLEGGEAITARLTELLAEYARPADGDAARIDLRHAADGDPRRRGQRHREDDLDRQDRLAPAPGARPARA